MLALQITDGHTLCRAIEYQKTPQISLALAPGTKLRIQNVPLCAGTLLLSSETVSVVGGRVEKLYSTWKLKQDAKGRKKAVDKLNPPPPFVALDFSQNKPPAKQSVQKQSEQKQSNAKTNTPKNKPNGKAKNTNTKPQKGKPSANSNSNLEKKAKNQNTQNKQTKQSNKGPNAPTKNKKQNATQKDNKGKEKKQEPTNTGKK